MTSDCSMNARTRIGPAHRGQTRGSTSYTGLISRSQARFASDGATSPNSSTCDGSSPWAFRRFPRFTLLSQPESAAQRSRFSVARAASFAGTALALAGRRARARPAPRHPRRRRGYPTERGGPPPRLGLSPGLCGPDTTDADPTYRTGVPHQVLPGVRDMRGQGGQPVARREHLEVPFQDRVHLRVVEDGAGL